MGVKAGEVEHGALEVSAVVHSRAQNDLSLTAYPDRPEPPQLTENVGRFLIAKHTAPQIQLGCVHADIEWRQPLLGQALPIILTEIGERDKVAVQKAEPII